MICALMDGRAFTAKELACHARVTAQTATQHLKVLEREGLITRLKSGRSTYIRLASSEVAAVVESLAVLSPTDHIRRPPPHGATPAMLQARTCYDHIAGRLGVAFAEHLCKAGHVRRNAEGFTLADDGVRLFEGLGIDVDALKATKRPIIRACLDWTERRHHVAGGIGAAVLTHALDHAWLTRDSASRALIVTPQGRAAFARHFGLDTAIASSENAPFDQDAHRR
jgi:DNA-binding transcriptional ArsR family regulator